MLALLVFIGGCSAKNGKDGNNDSTDADKIDINEYIKTVENPEDYIIIGNYKGVKVKEITVGDSDVEAFRAEVLNQYSYHAPIDKTVVENGDCVNIKYVSYLNGYAFEGGTGTDDIVVGEGAFVFPQVESVLVGVKVGNTANTTVTVDEDYFSKELRGKTISIEMTVVQIQEKGLTAPEIDDDFVKEHFGLDSAEEFEDYALDFVTKTAEDEMMTSAWQAVLANCEIISFPEDIDELYVDEMLKHYTEQAAKYGAGVELIIGNDAAAWRAQALKYAQGYYKSELAMYAIYDREFESREISDKEYRERLANYAKEQGVTTEELEKRYDKDEIVTSFHWDKVMEVVWENRVIE